MSYNCFGYYVFPFSSLEAKEEIIAQAYIAACLPFHHRVPCWLHFKDVPKSYWSMESLSYLVGAIGDLFHHTLEDFPSQVYALAGDTQVPLDPRTRNRYNGTLSQQYSFIGCPVFVNGINVTSCTSEGPHLTNHGHKESTSFQAPELSPLLRTQGM